MMNLLAAIDFSKSTDAVLAEASRLANAMEATLWLLHVASDAPLAIAYESPPYSDIAPDIGNMPGDVQLARNLNAEELRREHTELLRLSSGLKKEGISAQAVLIKGTPAKEIIDKATDIGADIILLGSHGHGLMHKALLGSVSESVIRHAACSVMVVPAPRK